MSVFDNPDLFQLATFVFQISTRDLTQNKRGLISSTGRDISVKFRIKPAGGNTEAREQGAFATASYTCNCVEPMVLPKDLKPGDIGRGIINNRQCTARITSISQGGVSPLTRDITGEKVNLEISYLVAGGSNV